MALTQEQQLAIDTLLKETTHLLKIEAVAGSGKTFSLVEMVKQYAPKTGIYLAFNKSIATEAQEKFSGTPIECSTIHSMAYKAIVRQWGLKVGWFNPRDVLTEDLNYTEKKEVVSMLEGFLNSNLLSPVEYVKGLDQSDFIKDSVLEHLDLMANGDIDSPHSFYLKMYHVMLVSGKLTTPEIDILLLDEAGDTNPVTLDIFRNFRAKKKVMVGDSSQNIYGFLDTVNAFIVLRDEGTTVRLTRSFRVESSIAKRIESFMHKHVDKKFEFKGRDYPSDYKPTTKGYIARTNSGLVSEMLHLKEQNIAFHTTRKIEQILELPLILANLANGRAITNSKYKVIEALRKNWESQSKRGNQTYLAEFKSPLTYVRKTLNDDTEIISAMIAIDKYGPHGLNSLADYSRSCINVDTGLTLTTAHSSKGLEFDVVEIAHDFNEKLHDTILKLKLTTKPKEVEALEAEFLLYYVATSRAMVKLENATHLPGKG